MEIFWTVQIPFQTTVSNAVVIILNPIHFNDFSSRRHSLTIRRNLLKRIDYLVPNICVFLGTEQYIACPWTPLTPIRCPIVISFNPLSNHPIYTKSNKNRGNVHKCLSTNLLVSKFVPSANLFTVFQKVILRNRLKFFHGLAEMRIMRSRISLTS